MVWIQLNPEENLKWQFGRDWRRLLERTRLLTLSKEEILRYSRHLIMPEVGMEGQLKLKRAKVLMIGTGGLGAPLGLYLAAAGVGRIGVVDFDVVDSTNLQRQVTFAPAMWAAQKSKRPRNAWQELILKSGSIALKRADQRKCAGHLARLRHHRRWHRQFSHALSGE